MSELVYFVLMAFQMPLQKKFKSCRSTLKLKKLNPLLLLLGSFFLITVSFLINFSYCLDIAELLT